MSSRTESEEIRAKIFGPTLDESGRIRACSSSQVKTHKLCPRKWWYQKVKKLPKGPKSKGAQESTEAHDRMEVWLKTGGDVRNGVERHGEEMLAEWLARMPWKPGGDMLVEDPLKDPELRTPGGVLVTGFFDAAVPPKADFQDGLAELRELPAVLDHKFLGDVGKWAATKESLETDEPQATMYMAWALSRWPNAPAVRFRHHNHQKKGARKNKPVEVVQTREQVFKRMADLGRYIDTAMQATAAIKDERSVPHGDLTSCCKAFGGCEYLKACPDAPHNRFMRAVHGDGDLPEKDSLPSRGAKPAAQTGYNLMGLMDDLNLGDAPPPPSGVSQQTAPKVTSTPAAPPSQQAAPVASANQPIPRLEAQAAVKNGVYMMPGGAVAKCKGVDGDKVLFVTKDKALVELELDDFVRDLNADPVATELFKRKLAITDVVEPAPAAPAVQQPPPAAPAAPKEVPGGNPPPVSAKAGVIPPDAPGDTNQQDPAKAAPAPAATPQPAPAEKTTEVKVTVAEAAQAAGNPQPQAPAATPAPKKRGRPAKAQTTPADGFILIVDSSSTVGESLDEHVAKLASIICEREGLADLRLAPKGNDAAFMGWRGLLAIEAKKYLPTPGTVLVGSSGDLADPVIEALAPLASIYVKGARR